jgi:hypothetical protein
MQQLTPCYRIYGSRDGSLDWTLPARRYMGLGLSGKNDSDYSDDVRKVSIYNKLLHSCI